MVEIIFTKTLVAYIIGTIILLGVLGYNIYLMKRFKQKASGKEKIKEIKIKPQKEIKKEEVNKSFNILKTKSKLSLGYWKGFFMDKYFPEKIVLVNMELVNGFHRTFVVKEKEEGFQFNKKKYLFDDDNKYYNMDAKLYSFDYHEGITLPIKRKIPVTDIKKVIESTEGIDVEYAVNPATLQRFMTAKLAEGVMKGTQLDEFFRKIQMFLIITMVAVLIHFALFVYGSGMLQNIKVPFVG